MTVPGYSAQSFIIVFLGLGENVAASPFLPALEPMRGGGRPIENPETRGVKAEVPTSEPES